MSRRTAALVAGATAVVAILALVWWSTSERRSGEAPAAEEVAPGTPLETTSAELYFPNTAGWLGVESRELPAAADAEARAAQVARALLEGPREPNHVAPVGEGVELSTIHLSGDGVVFVDLAAVQLAMPPVSGSRGELLAVYSFVNSILVNVPEARGVVLLWNGDQRPTFAGHVDTTRPLPAAPQWVARRTG